MFLWVSLVLSLPVAFYAGTGFIYYAWRNTADPQNWPAERAAPWAYGHLVLAVLFLGLFVYSVFSLIRAANRKNREKQQQHNI